MSGNQCSDFGAGALLDAANNPTLFCIEPDKNPHAGLVTYRDGRVAEITDDSKAADGQLTFALPDKKGGYTVAGLTADQVKKNKDLQGAEIGDCGVASERSTYLLLPTVTSGGKRITWSPDHLRTLGKAMNQEARQSGNAVFCSNNEAAPAVGLNRAAADKIQNAYNTLKNDHMGLDDDHYGIVMESLKRALGIPPTQDHTSDLIGVGITFVLVGVVGGIVSFAAKAIWDKIFKGPKDPKDGPGGGGGSGGPRKEMQVVDVNGIPHWYNNGEIIGPVRREGVVTEDQGAMIYKPEYQAIVDGHYVALLDESGLQSLRGGEYTSEEFSLRAEALLGGIQPSSDPAAPYRALFANNVSVNYGALGYAQSTRTAVSGAPNALVPGFKPTMVPLTLGGAGATSAFRMPSIAVEPVPVLAR